MADNRFNCGCENIGGLCTRISMCLVQDIVEDHKEAMLIMGAENKRLKDILNQISDSLGGIIGAIESHNPDNSSRDISDGSDQGVCHETDTENTSCWCTRPQIP